ncbi:MAG TPA: hypothetical protein VIR59_08970 [Gaiellaceae bacterium]
MKLRVSALLALVLAALAFTGSALAFDCIRVSSSLQGLQQSTRSGKWALFNLSSGPALQQSLAALGEDVDGATAACVSSEYLASGLSPYFALGFGVAGPNGVLAHNNPNDTVLGDLRGIDHLDDSPIGAALFGAAADCGLPVGD